MIRTPVTTFNIRYDDEVYGAGNVNSIINGIDWNRAVLQAMGYHLAQGHRGDDICGPCLKHILLNPPEGRR